MNRNFTIVTLFSMLILVSIWGCQPLSSKKNTNPLKTPPTKTAKSEDTTAIAQVPNDSQLVRRKIPTLREQMEKLQNQQEVTNNKIDTLRNEINSLKKEIRDSKAIKEDNTADFNFKGDPQTDEQNPNQLKKKNTPVSAKPKKNAVMETQDQNNPEGIGSKRNTDIIEPDNADLKQSLPKSSKSTKKNSDIILPDGNSDVPPVKDSQPNGKKKSKDIILPDEPANESKKPEKQNTVNKTTESTIASKKNNTGSESSTVVEKKSSNKVQAEEPKPTGKSDSDIDVVYNSAISLYGKRQYQESIDLMSQVVNSAPNPERAAAANFYIGRSYFAQNKYDDAISSFDKVVKSKNSAYTANSLGLLGECYLKKGNVNEAKKYYKKVQTQFPNSEAIVLANKRLQQY